MTSAKSTGHPECFKTHYKSMRFVLCSIQHQKQVFLKLVHYIVHTPQCNFRTAPSFKNVFSVFMMSVAISSLQRQVNQPEAHFAKKKKEKKEDHPVPQHCYTYKVLPGQPISLKLVLQIQQIANISCKKTISQFHAYCLQQ